MPTTTPTPEKPTLLLLHGSGTNADIFRLQSRKLAALLSPHFTLLYPDAPLPCDPGPGVLPFFEGCGPYLTWMDDSTPEGEYDYWAGDKIQELVGEVREKGVVGVVGFSMGGKVGMEVVRRLEAESDQIKIVVAVCGTVPFQGGVGTQGGGEDEVKAGWYRESLGKGVVKAQSVHLIGEGDPWRAESEKLVEFFGEEGRRVVRFRGEHHMPVEDALNRQVVRMILAACGGA